MATAKRADVLAFCRALPHVTEDVKWGADLVFSIGGKMFAVFGNDGVEATFSCKVHEDDFAAVTSVEGIVPAPYAARYHWIHVDDPHVLPHGEAVAMLRASYELVKAKLPRKLQNELGGTSAPSSKPTERTVTKRRSSTTKAVGGSGARVPEKKATASKKVASKKPSPTSKKMTSKTASPKSKKTTATPKKPSPKRPSKQNLRAPVRRQ